MITAFPACAQESDKEDRPVTVTGKKPQNGIDRQTYDNKSIDTAGSAADALNKVPSVTVDANGNVALRGNKDVQVLIDGKPSALMSGDNRAAALQAMSSGQIASVEVMATPGAQFGSAGSGGIINLVTAKNRKPGASGTVTVAAGLDGRYNGAFNGSYRQDKLGVTGALSYRHDDRPGRRAWILRRQGTGAMTTSSGTATSVNDSLSASGGIEYTFSDRDSVAAQLSVMRRDIDAGNRLAYSDFDAGGQVVRGYERASAFGTARNDASVALSWSHTGDSAGETFKADLRLSRSDADLSDRLTSNLTGGTTVDNRTATIDQHGAVLSADYGQMLGATQVAAGVQIAQDSSDSLYLAQGPGAAATPDSAFAFDQTLNAAYVTLQRTLGDRWIVLGGLRVETLDLDTDMITGGTTGHIAYSRVDPSLFATRILSPSAKLRLSYARRLQRPSPYDLNPYTLYVDPQNLSAGNPALKPQETDAFEVGYEHSGSVTSYQLRAFYRSSDRVVTPSSRFIAPDVLLTTKDNLGSGDSIGTEFNFTTRWGSKLSVNASGDLSRIRLTTPQAGTRRVVALNGRVNLDYAATAKDRIQVSYTVWGAQLTGQGEISGSGNASLAWRHVLTPKVSVLVSVADPFGMTKFRVVTDTPVVYQEQVSSLRSRNLIMSLTWTLGATR